MQRDQWNHTALSLAVLCNLHRGEGQAALGMEVFHPFHQHSAAPRGMPITADNVAAIGRMFAKAKN